MLLTITNTRTPATDMGWLLHKNPARCQEFELNFGKAHVFYPDATPDRCTAALLLDIDPVGIVRGKLGSGRGGPLDQYVNDRPYVSSSFLSVAIAKVYGSALSGKCGQKPELVETPLPLTAKLSVLPSRGGEAFLRGLFEPLGYEVRARRRTLDPVFPEWGESVYYTVELEKETTLKDLLTHLYVLIPVLDNKKHYFIGEAEVDNLLSKGKGWLAQHPRREEIARRYLKYRTSLARQALTQLALEERSDLEPSDLTREKREAELEKGMSLNDLRLGAVLAALKASGARKVLDLGCGEGRLLRELLREKTFVEIVGMDVSIRSLEIAHRRLGLDRLPDRVRQRITLLHGSLMYRDKRLEGFDAASAVEVIEHLDRPRLAAFERVLFECAKPGTVVLTTPNREYNGMWENLAEGDFRHKDHRFEWTREEFRAWGGRVAETFGYTVHFLSIGPEDATVGAPTQMGVFHRAN